MKHPGRLGGRPKTRSAIYAAAFGVNKRAVYRAGGWQKLSLLEPEVQRLLLGINEDGSKKECCK